MILELFVPKKLFGRRLIAEKTIGIAIEGDHIVATLVHKTSASTTVEHVDRQALAASGDAFAARVSAALRELLPRLPAHDSITAVVPASLVLFKELSLPLTSRDKIAMVIEFELEEQLPFAVDDAVVDFIITEQSSSTSTVLAAAIRTRDLAALLAMYQDAGIAPERLTLDMFALYDLFLQIPSYTALEGAVALIDIGQRETRIGFLEGSMLRRVRTLPQGADTIGEVASFLGDVQFTLNAFMQKLNYYGQLNTVLFSPASRQIPSLLAHSEKILHTKAAFFDMQKLIDEEVLNANVSVQALNEATLCIGAAQPSKMHESFNLLRKSFAKPNIALMRKQIIAALGLLGALLCIAIGGSLLQVRRLASHAARIENHETQKLLNLLHKAARQTSDPALSQMIKRAQRASTLGPLLAQMKTITTAEEETWGALHARALPAREALLALTNLIDREQFSVSINTVTLSNGDDGSTNIELRGVLRPKQMGEEYTEYAKFEQALDEDKTRRLALIDSNPGQIDEKQGGLTFNVTLRKKTEVQA